MSDNCSFSEIRSRIASADAILIATHSKPDGDAIGSALALAEFLKSQGKKVSAVLPDGIPELYAITQYDFLREAGDGAAYDLVILLDTAAPALAGFDKNGGVPDWAFDKLQVIDHHKDNPRYGKWNYVVNRAATAEIVFELCESWGVPVGESAASPALMGLLTDTGGLRFNNTDPAALRSAARMLEAGANHNKVVNQIYFNKPYNQQQFEAELLSSCIHWACNKKAAWATVPQEMLDKYNFNLRNAEGVIDELRAIAGTEVVAMITYRGEQNYRISLRSKNPARPVDALARSFGGGGHAMAAGMSMQASSLDEVSEIFAREVKKLFPNEE